jgi:hypothetical protein
LSGLFRTAGAETLQAGLWEVRILPFLLGLLLTPVFFGDKKFKFKTKLTSGG